MSKADEYVKWAQGFANPETVRLLEAAIDERAGSVARKVLAEHLRTYANCELLIDSAKGWLLTEADRLDPPQIVGVDLAKPGAEATGKQAVNDPADRATWREWRCKWYRKIRFRRNDNNIVECLSDRVPNDTWSSETHCDKHGGPCPGCYLPESAHEPLGPAPHEWKVGDWAWHSASKQYGQVKIVLDIALELHNCPDKVIRDIVKEDCTPIPAPKFKVGDRVKSADWESPAIIDLVEWHNVDVDGRVGWWYYWTGNYGRVGQDEPKLSPAPAPFQPVEGEYYISTGGIVCRWRAGKHEFFDHKRTNQWNDREAPFPAYSHRPLALGEVIVELEPNGPPTLAIVLPSAMGNLKKWGFSYFRVDGKDVLGRLYPGFDRAAHEARAKAREAGK